MTACPPNANWPSASALAVLETLRMVERRPNSGIYLRSVERHGSIEAMVLQAELGVPLAEAEVREVVELREIMEVQGICLAARRRHEDDIQRLDTILAEGARLASLGENLADYDAAFHLAIVEATGNHVFLRVVNASLRVCSLPGTPVQAARPRRYASRTSLLAITTVPATSATRLMRV